MNEALYNEHFDEMIGSINLDELPETEVDRILHRLILSMPNEGKFYKYRKGEGEAYVNAYNSLKEGYLWVAQASTLNDELDSTVNFDPVSDVEDVKNYIFNHPVAVFNMVFKKAHEHGGSSIQFAQNPIDDYMMGQALTCYDLDTGERDEEKSINLISSYGYTRKEAKSWLLRVDKYICDFMKNYEGALEDLVKRHLEFNKNLRSITYVFSVSERYDSNTMWSYYSNNNGFCIEYDFKKVLALPLETRRKFISFYKVIYNDDKATCSFLPYVKWFLGGKQDDELLKAANRQEITQILTKQEQWQHEKEWRLVLCEVDNKLYADLVSAIYMDEPFMQTENGKKLKDLAIEKNWKLFVRKLNVIGTKHEYNKIS